MLTRRYDVGKSMIPTLNEWDYMILRELSFKSLFAVGAPVIVLFLDCNPLLMREIANRGGVFPHTMLRIGKSALREVGSVILSPRVRLFLREFFTPLSTLSFLVFSVSFVPRSTLFTLLICIEKMVSLISNDNARFAHVAILVEVCERLRDSGESASLRRANPDGAVGWNWECHAASSVAVGVSRVLTHPTLPFYQEVA